jgi:hypothetical protein
MRTWILAVAAATIPAADVCTQGGPESFQIELSGGWSLNSIDTNPDIDITQVDIGGTYYLQPVALADHPWNEAAFLEHSMGVMAGLRYTKFEIAGFSADGPSIGVGFLYADKKQPVAAQFNFSFGTLDGDMGLDIDQTDVNAWAGYWLQPNALVGAAVDYGKTDAQGGLAIEELYFGAFGKIVHDLGEGRAINAEAHVGLTSVDVAGSSETNFDIGVEGDYYFTPRYSAGAILDFSFGDATSNEGTTIGVRGSAWISPQASVQAMYSKFSASDSLGADQDEFGISFKLRF